MYAVIEAKVTRAREALGEIGYIAKDISWQEFYDYMTGEIFSDDTTTLDDVLGNEFLMVHETGEISELKKMGKTIDKRVVVDSPRTTVYEAHFTAMELELTYALFRKDYFWMKMRLRQHKESVVEDDPNLPESLRPRAEEIFRKFSDLVRQSRKGS